MNKPLFALRAERDKLTGELLSDLSVYANEEEVTEYVDHVVCCDEFAEGSQDWVERVIRRMQPQLRSYALQKWGDLIRLVHEVYVTERREVAELIREVRGPREEIE